MFWLQVLLKNYGNCEKLREIADFNPHDEIGALFASKLVLEGEEFRSFLWVFHKEPGSFFWHVHQNLPKFAYFGEIWQSFLGAGNNLVAGQARTSKDWLKENPPGRENVIFTSQLGLQAIQPIICSLFGRVNSTASSKYCSFAPGLCNWERRLGKLL